MRQSHNWNGWRPGFAREQEAFGWRDMRPLLLRSCGVVGLAGAIVAAVSNDALFIGTADTKVPPPAVWQDPSEPDEPVAAVIDPTELRESGDPIIFASERIETAAPARESDAAIRGEVSSGGQQDLVFMAEPVVGALERTVFKAPSVEQDQAPPPVEVMQPLPVSTSASAPAAASANTPSVDEDSAAREAEDLPRETASVEQVIALLDARMTASSEDAERAVALRAAAQKRQADASMPEAGAARLWAEEAVDCPRNWMAPADAPTDCEPILAMLPPSAEPGDQAALEDAAEAHAQKLSTLGPRVPRLRPEPSAELIKAVTRVAAAPQRRRSSASDWPAAPPPNCGTKHAYWRFVDRQAGTKEWYCK